MRVSVDVSQLSRTKWYEYVVRFLFGGLTTVCAGLIANHFGPIVGGLFLGFPAIFPATATLLEKHQREKKQKAGIPRTVRGRQAAAVDAMGTALGSVGLVGFAAVIWKTLPIARAPLTILAAIAVWLAFSILIWHLRKTRLSFKGPQHLPARVQATTSAQDFRTAPNSRRKS
jgi:uncharacterized protein DUF3147